MAVLWENLSAPLPLLPHYKRGGTALDNILIVALISIPARPWQQTDVLEGARPCMLDLKQIFRPFSPRAKDMRSGDVGFLVISLPPPAIQTLDSLENRHAHSKEATGPFSPPLGDVTVTVRRNPLLSPANWRRVITESTNRRC